MNSSVLVLALSAAAVLCFAFLRALSAARQTAAGPRSAHARKLPRDWRRWLFGEHNIPFS